MGELERDQQASNGQSTGPSLGKLGMQLQDLTEQQLAELELERGVGVVRVAQDGAADKAGIMRGDVLLSIGGEQVANRDEAEALIEALAVDQAIAVRFMRRGAVRFTSVTPTEAN